MSTGITPGSGSSVRDATINGRPVQSPLQVAEFLEQVVKKQLASALSPEDKAAMERANKKLMIHATTVRSNKAASLRQNADPDLTQGLFIGSTLGATLAFRRRWMAGYRAAQARSTTATPQGSVPKLFYPPGTERPTPRGETIGGSKLGFIAKGLGLGMLGALIGTQIGVWSGTRAAQKVIKETGHEDRIAQSLKQAMDRAMAEIQANSTGIEINHALLKKAQMQQGGAGSSAYGDPSSLETDEPELYRSDSFASEESEQSRQGNTAYRF